MRESPDKQLDDCIVRALRAETTLTLQQQNRVWEALLQNAAQQPILPPVEFPLHTRVFIKARKWGKVWLVHLYNFILDDTAYRRAHYHYPAITRHQRPRSTFAAAEFMLIA